MRLPQIRRNANAWWVTIDGIVYQDPAKGTTTQLEARQNFTRLTKERPKAEVKLWSGHRYKGEW